MENIYVEHYQNKSLGNGVFFCEQWNYNNTILFFYSSRCPTTTLGTVAIFKIKNKKNK